MKRIALLHWITSLSLLALVGCIGHSTPVLARAPQVLQCPEEQLEVNATGDRAFTVTGCGRAADFVCVGGGQVIRFEGKRYFEWRAQDLRNPPIECIREGEVRVSALK
jgi:hypothetical protein